MIKKKSNYIRLSIVYYSLESNTDRYVFYFHKEDHIVEKLVLYVVDSDYSQFNVNFKQFLEEKKLTFNEVCVYIVKNTTRMKYIKLPLRQFNIFNKKYINEFLKEDFGSSCFEKYSVSSKKVAKENKTVIYRQIIESKKVLETINNSLSFLNITEYKLCNLPDTLEKFCQNKGYGNKIVLFFEASYIIVATYINGLIQDFLCVNDSNRLKIENGFYINLQLNDVEKIILSFISKYSNDNVDLKDVVLFCNSSRKLEKFTKKQNVLGLNTEILKSNDSLFLENYKQNNWTKGFTLVETVVSFAIFSIIMAITASLIVFTINTNNKNKQISMINNYIYSINESFQANPYIDNVKKITGRNEIVEGVVYTYYLNDNCDYLIPSSNDVNMSYKIDCEYLVNNFEGGSNIQNFSEYIFSFLGVYKIGNSNSIINPILLTVVLWV